jgi:adhesin transport system membrane fusion protein
MFNFNKRGQSTQASSQSDRMSNRRYFELSAEDEQDRRSSRLLVLLTGLVVVAVVVWASIFKLDEITRGQGQVIPSSRVQIIQSLDAGILSEMLVREGDAVEHGQVLLRIDDARSGASYREAKEKWLGLLSLSVRLRAEAYGTDLVFPVELNEKPELTVREKQAFIARKRSLDEQLSALSQSLAAVSRELALITPLVRQGLVSEVEQLRLQRQQADLKGQMAERRNRYLTDANNELVKVGAELSQSYENVLGRQDVFRRSTIVSPMKGIVKNVTVTTLGAVVSTGQNILEIVPVQDEMIVEAYVKPTEIAFLKIGLPAVVKLTAFDYNKYGGFNGVVQHLSSDTLRQDSRSTPKSAGASFELEEGMYRILVRINDAEREKNGLILTPKPGMTAEVEIRTGSKRVIEYLFRPLQNVTRALRER